MTEIGSDSYTLTSSDEAAFVFLSDLNNHQKIMPSNVSDWWSTEEEAKMKLQGIGTLHLKREVSQANSFIKIVPIGAAPVDLYIEWHIVKIGDTCQAKVVFFAELNMMMKMLAEKPLLNLANSMAGKLNEAIKNI